MKALIYVRQSQDRTGEELGVTRQMDDGRQLAKLRGWHVPKELELVENDTSAAGKKVREKFEQVLASIESGEVGAVIAWDMTRLSRNRRDTVRLLEAGEKARVVLAFVRGTDLDLSTPAGQLTADILSSVARNETAVKSDRQRRASLQAAQQGRRIGGRRPFGYGPVIGTEERTDPRTGKTGEYQLRDYNALIPEEADALRDAYASVIQGVSLGRIAKEWNAKGLLTPQLTREGEPSRWTGQTVRPVLLNPRYAGLRHHVDERTRATMNPVKARLQNIVGAAQWPAIVDQATWEAVRVILTNPDRANPARSERRLLTGIAHCGGRTEAGEECGAMVHGGANPQHQPTYRCSVAYGHIGRRSEPVDEFVSEYAIAFLSRPDAVDLLVDDDQPDVDALRTELSTLRTRLEEQAREHALGNITTLQLRAGTDVLRRRIEQVDGALGDLAQVSILGPLVHAADVREAWDALDAERQRAVIDRVMVVTLLPVGRGTRTFRPETVRIERRTRGGAP